MGAVIMQHNYSVAYFSRKRNYTTIEKELLSVVPNHALRLWYYDPHWPQKSHLLLIEYTACAMMAIVHRRIWPHLHICQRCWQQPFQLFELITNRGRQGRLLRDCMVGLRKYICMRQKRTRTNPCLWLIHSLALLTFHLANFTPQFWTMPCFTIAATRT